jgi:plastocyanin
MTDETPDSGSVATDPAPAETVPAPAEGAAIEPATAERVPFWQRPNVDRYLAPAITPILVLIGILVYVLNVSRVFLSAHGHTSVVVGSFLTLVILVGATVLSNSSRLRSQTIVLLTAGFLLVMFSSGWLVLGHSQIKNASNATLPIDGPSQGTITIIAQPGAALTFAPSSLSLKTGIYTVVLKDGANTTHTLNFDQSVTLWPGLVVSNQGETLHGRIFFPANGPYTFYCAVPGHRAAGMQGVIQVTGPPMTLTQALAAAGKSPGAAAGSGGSGGS